MSPPVVGTTVKVARVVFTTAGGWDEEIGDDGGEDGAKGEEHRQQCQEVLLGVRKVLEE